MKIHLIRPDKWAPKKEKLPTLVWIVGGGFRCNAPLKFAPEFSYLVKAGYNVVMIDYRVSGQEPFPGAVQDAKTAIRFLRAHADQYGIDENRIGVMGGSAGGYLATMLGTTAGMKEFETDEWAGYDSSVKAVIDLYGILDFKDAMENPTPADNTHYITPIRLFVGEDGAKDEKLLHLSNPINFVSEKTPPFLILHGTADIVVSYQNSIKLYEALQAKGIPSDLYLLENVNHATHEFWQPEIKELILEFLKQNL